MSDTLMQLIEALLKSMDEETLNNLAATLAHADFSGIDLSEQGIDQQMMESLQSFLQMTLKK